MSSTTNEPTPVKTEECDSCEDSTKCDKTQCPKGDLPACIKIDCAKNGHEESAAGPDESAAQNEKND